MNLFVDNSHKKKNTEKTRCHNNGVIDWYILIRTGLNWLNKGLRSVDTSTVLILKLTQWFVSWYHASEYSGLLCSLSICEIWNYALVFNIFRSTQHGRRKERDLKIWAADALAQSCPIKSCSEKLRKVPRKARATELFLVKLEPCGL